MNHLPSHLLLGFFTFLLLPACGGDGATSNSGSGDGSGGSSSDVTVDFTGPTDAIPLTPETVLVAWLAASNSLNDGPQTMAYTVYRGDSVDFNTAETSANDTQTLQGAPSGNPSVAVQVASNTTHFFKVAVTDSHGNTVESPKVVSAHTPAAYVSGESDYITDVVPFSWELEGVDGSGTPTGQTCVSCHTSTATLDLTSYAGLMNGTGTSTNPDSFVFPGQDVATWGSFQTRFDPLSPDHADFVTHAPLIRSVLKPWAAEGALEEIDGEGPFFDFQQVGVEGLYTATPDWENQTVDIQFFHASDPESTPYDSTILYDHLTYNIYGGVDSNSIDWVTPLATIGFTFDALNNQFNGSFLLSENSYTHTIQNWASNSGAFVVRALDFLGNESTNERVLTIQR